MNICRSSAATATVALAVLAVAIPVGAQSTQYYVLDGFGGVHAAGGAPVISPGTPYFGFDVAQDLAYVPYGAPGSHGDGILVLDRFGGVHGGGALLASSPDPRPPYFAFDIARAITYRNVPSRAAGAASSTATLLTTTSSSFSSMLAITIDAPDDGFLLVNASTSTFCQTSSGTATVEVRVGVDSTSGDLASSHWGTFADCSAAGPGVISPIESISIAQVFFVSAGQHTVHLLARKAGGTQGVFVDSRSVTAVFIDQNASGVS